MSKKKNSGIKVESPDKENIHISSEAEDKKEKKDKAAAGEAEEKAGEQENGDNTGVDKEADPGGPGDEPGKEDKKDPRDEKIEELNDKNLRLMAEFENFRKRSEKEKDQMFETGAKSVIEKVLPVIDNFERALDMASADTGEGEDADPFMDGMKKVYKQLMDELEKIGVTPIEAVGQEFDPEYHNAVMQVDSEEYDSGIVAQELQKGYRYNDSVVRHSMVGVAK